MKSYFVILSEINTWFSNTQAVSFVSVHLTKGKKVPTCYFQLYFQDVWTIHITLSTTNPACWTRQERSQHNRWFSLFQYPSNIWCLADTTQNVQAFQLCCCEVQGGMSQSKRWYSTSKCKYTTSIFHPKHQDWPSLYVTKDNLLNSYETWITFFRLVQGCSVGVRPIGCHTHILNTHSCDWKQRIHPSNILSSIC